MSNRNQPTLEQRDNDDALERALARESRMDEPLTRLEVVDAIENVAREYGAHGNPEAGLIRDAFRRLAVELA
jgi:hypothetical protein